MSAHTPVHPPGHAHLQPGSAHTPHYVHPSGFAPPPGFGAPPAPGYYAPPLGFEPPPAPGYYAHTLGFAFLPRHLTPAGDLPTCTYAHTPEPVLEAHYPEEFPCNSHELPRCVYSYNQQATAYYILGAKIVLCLYKCVIIISLRYHYDATMI